MDDIDKLAESLAQEIWCIGAADQMIVRAEALTRWQHHKEARSQKYLGLTHDALTALIALGKLGYGLAPGRPS